MILLVTLSTLLFARAVERPDRRRDWILYAVVSVLAVYCHIFAILVPAAQWLAVGRRRLREIGLPRLARLAAAFALAVTPAVAFAALHDSGQLQWLWATTTGDVLLAVAMLSGYNVVAFLAGLAGVVRAALAFRGDEDRDFRLRLLGTCVVFPLAAVLAVSLAVKPVFFFRYFGICIPAAVLLAAWVLTPEKPMRRWKTVAVTVLVLFAIAQSLLVVWGGREVRSTMSGDWKAATEHLLARSRPGDVLVFDLSAGLDPYRYYAQRTTSREAPLPHVVFPGPEVLASANRIPSREELETAIGAHRRIWVVLHQPRSAYLRPLLERFRVADQKTFLGIVAHMNVTVALYERTD
jgi:hypothetical protein